MVAQPLRAGALACAYALATAALVLVTVLASNLVLTVVAGLGPATAAAPAADGTAVEGVLLSAGQRPEGDGCDRRGDRAAEPRAERRQRDQRCGERRDDSVERRP